MKFKLLLIAIALFFCTIVIGQTSGTCCSNVLLTGYSEKSYTSEPVTGQQIDLILKCGINAPSAKNLQPWKFTVIKDEPTMKAIIENIVPGNVVIIVSGTGGEDELTPDFDCALATQSMFIAAHSLGLGARIYTGPVGRINSDKELFQIPSGYQAIAALRIGNPDKTVDAVSAASPRKAPEEVINYKENE